MKPESNCEYGLVCVLRHFRADTLVSNSLGVTNGVFLLSLLVSRTLEALLSRSKLLEFGQVFFSVRAHIPYMALQLYLQDIRIRLMNSKRQ